MPVIIPQAPPAKPEAKSGGSRFRTALILGFIVLLAIMFTSSLITSAKNSSGASGSSKAKTGPPVTITISRIAIGVHNKGDKPLSGLTIYLNDIPGGYEYSGVTVSPGEDLKIPLSEFIKGDDRFPASKAVVKLWIGGGGYDYAEFRK